MVRNSYSDPNISPTMSGYHLRGLIRNHALANVIIVCVSSRRDLNLFKCVTRCIPGIKPIHLNGLVKRGAQVLQKFCPGCTLRVHTADFFDPSDPEIAISLDYCRIFVHVDHDTTNMPEPLRNEYR